jgi:RNA polymerase sigma-70 factor (ECF subfamily)
METKSSGQSEVLEVEVVAEPPSAEIRRELLAHYRRLLAHARVLVHDEATAEDLVQDTLERALRASQSFRAGTNARAWLTRIMRNLFTDRYRHKTAIREVALDTCECWLAAEEPRRTTYLDVVSIDDVLAALGELDARLRELFVLKHIEHVPYEDIARRYGMNPSTVGTALRRARRRLQRIVEKRLGRSEGSVVISFPRKNDVPRRNADRSA